MTDSESNRAKPQRVGLFSYAPLPDDRVAAVKRSFAALGYREGREIAFEVRSSDRDPVLTARHAEELVGLELDLIWGMNTNATVALRKAMAQRRIPVVFWATDPVESGILDDLQQKGHFTGFAAPVDLQLLQLRFIKATFPGLQSVPLLYNSTYGPAPSAMRQLQLEAKLYGMAIEVCEVASLQAIEPELSRIREREGRAFLVGPHALFNTNGGRIGELALKHGLAAIAVQESVVRGGGLVSFFPSSRHIQAGILSMIDRILRGTPAADIPIDRKIGFTMAINTLTIGKLDLAVPEFLLREADHLIGAT
jgi:putative tryptophan/tyrosine transport system substrate-binding protein